MPASWNVIHQFAVCQKLRDSSLSKRISGAYLHHEAYDLTTSARHEVEVVYRGHAANFLVCSAGLAVGFCGHHFRNKLRRRNQSNSAQRLQGIYSTIKKHCHELVFVRSKRYPASQWMSKSRLDGDS